MKKKDDFKFFRDFSKINWKATGQVNIIRAAFAGPVIGILMWLSTGKINDLLVYAFLFPVLYVIALLPMSLLFYWLGAVGVPFTGIFTTVFSLMVAVGDPFTAILSKRYPHLVPVENFGFFNFTPIIFILFKKNEISPIYRSREDEPSLITESAEDESLSVAEDKEISDGGGIILDGNNKSEVTYLFDQLSADDPHEVKEAALSLGRLKASAAVPALIAAFDDGGYAQYRNRPQNLEGLTNFGAYRDKIQGLCEALLMIGDQKGLEVAETRLNQLFSDAKLIGVRVSMDSEKTLLERVTKIKETSDWHGIILDENLKSDESYFENELITAEPRVVQAENTASRVTSKNTVFKEPVADEIKNKPSHSQNENRGYKPFQILFAIVGCLIIGYLIVRSLPSNNPATVQSRVVTNLPVSSAVSTNVSESEVVAFIQKYNAAINNHDIESLLSYYDDQVNYFQWGTVTKSSIRKDKSAYFHKWKAINFSAEGNLTPFNMPAADQIKVRFITKYSVQNERKKSQGSAENTWILKKTGNDIRIMDEKQTVLASSPHGSNESHAAASQASENGTGNTIVNHEDNSLNAKSDNTLGAAESAPVKNDSNSYTPPKQVKIAWSAISDRFGNRINKVMAGNQAFNYDFGYADANDNEQIQYQLYCNNNFIQKWDAVLRAGSNNVRFTIQGNLAPGNCLIRLVARGAVINQQTLSVSPIPINYSNQGNYAPNQVNRMPNPLFPQRR